MMGEGKKNDERVAEIMKDRPINVIKFGLKKQVINSI